MRADAAGTAGYQDRAAGHPRLRGASVGQGRVHHPAAEDAVGHQTRLVLAARERGRQVRQERVVGTVDQAARCGVFEAGHVAEAPDRGLCGPVTATPRHDPAGRRGQVRGEGLDQREGVGEADREFGVLGMWALVKGEQ